MIIDDLATYAQTNSIGTIGSTLFEGHMPATPDNCVCIYETGGLELDRDIPVEEPTFQVLIRNKTYAGARAKAASVVTAFQAVRNQTLTATYFYYIFAQQSPYSLGRDENERAEITVNFICKIRR